MVNGIAIAAIVITILIVLWLIFLAVDYSTSLFIFAPYNPPPLENAFQPAGPRNPQTIN